MKIVNFTKTFAALLVLLYAAGVGAEEKYKMLEEAIEGEPETFFLGQNLSGVVRGATCDGCPVVKLTITSESQAYLDKQSVSLSDMAKTSKKPYLTFFDPDTKKVTRMYWQSK